MNAIPNSIVLFRLLGVLVVCWAVPVLLCYLVGPTFGVIGALGAAVFWYVQYRLPAWRERSGFSFWFVVSGYGIIGVTLLVSLGRMMGVSLL
jgi:hypothetical protein